jgi:MFS family permease
MMLFSFTSILGGLKEELVLTNTQFGLLLSAFSIAFAVAQIPGGVLSDKFGGKAVCLFGVSIMAVAALIFSFSVDFSAALFIRCLAGFTGGLILPSAVKLLSDWYPLKERSVAMGIFGLGQGLGFVVTYALGSVVVQYLGWRVGSLFSGIFASSAAIFALIFLKDRTKPLEVERHPMMLGRENNLNRGLLLLILVNFSGLAVLSGILQFAPQFLLLRFHFSTLAGGFVTSIVGVMNMLASYGGGFGSKKFGGGTVVLVSMLMCTMFPVFLGYSYSTTLVFIIVALVGFATMFYFGPLFAGVSQVGERHPGTIFGIFNATSFGAAAMSPLIIGYILDTTHAYELAFTSLSIIAMIGLVAAVTLTRTGFFVGD